MKHVVLYGAPECHLCARARAVIHDVRTRFDFAFSEVDISGDDALEERYRVFLPVVEIEGERRFVYEVDAGELERELAQKGS